MIDIDDALRRVLAHCQSRGSQDLPTSQAVGHVLAEDISSDVDSPPHDKSLVDGFAVRLADLDPARQPLRVLEQVVAGTEPKKPLAAGCTTNVMTGAPVPQGTEAMVMVEQTERVDDQHVRILASQMQAGRNIMRRATCFATGEPVLRKGARLRPLEVGLLGEVGRLTVSCFTRPRVAILSTGDELVPCTQQPGPGQIRNSNGPMLESYVRQLGCPVVPLDIGRDDASQLRTQIERGLEADVLVLSGGVSAGVRDLVPATLDAMGVEQVFHKVRLKPGKPLWFGVRQSKEPQTLVFGLPGNPVSSLVCFWLFVKPALLTLSGDRPEQDPQLAELVESFEQRGERLTFFPAKVWREQDGRWLVAPLPYRGSSDMKAYVDANGLILFPAGDRTFPAGDMVEVYRF